MLVLLMGVALPTGRRARLVAVCVLIATALGGAVAIVVAVLPPPLTMVAFTPSDESIRNPERGWFDSVDLADPTTITSAARDDVTIVRTYIRLDAFRAAPIDAATLAALDRGFAAVRAARMKVVVRVAYNTDGAGQDAPLDRIREHAAQLKPLLARNQDVVFSFEAGFIGTWGEWHSSTNGVDSAQAKAQVLKVVLAAFPRSRTVALRYPADIRRLLPRQVSAASAYGGAAASRIGNHQDCFLSSAPDDGGTWGQDGGSVYADKRLVSSLGRYTVVGGETCGVSSRTTCPTALRKLGRLHFSY